MTIKFSWGTGWMEMKAEHLVESITMINFKKWAKMFAKYGTTEQHREFLQFVIPYIGTQEAKCADLEQELAERQAKADGRQPTVMTHDYWMGEVKRYQSKLNGANTKLKRYKTIYQVVEGLVS